eukprot:Opistho-1_new@81183
MFTEHAQHAPLLVRQTVLAQAGPGVQHHGLARFEQQARQVAVDEGGGVVHLFNMLNEFSGNNSRVYPERRRGENARMNALTSLLGTEHPLIQAPMAGVQGAALAVAVSNAGALGSLPCAMLTPEAMERELTTIQAGTQHPFNVNFFCHTPPEPDEAREAAWRFWLATYYEEAGIDIATVPPCTLR